MYTYLYIVYVMFIIYVDGIINSERNSTELYSIIQSGYYVYQWTNICFIIITMHDAKRACIEHSWPIWIEPYLNVKAKLISYMYSSMQIAAMSVGKKAYLYYIAYIN